MNHDHLDMIRAALPAVQENVYLNTGTAGPLPEPARRAMIDQIEREYTRGRANFAEFTLLRETITALRPAFARLLGADANEIALTHHTSEGINIATWGLNWQRGDEVLVTTLEHEAGLLPAYVAAQRHGLDVRVVDLGLGDDPQAVLAAIERTMGPRTRLISLSHVSWSSGVVLPLAEIVALAHSRGVLVLVDGAQSAGAIPIDVHALGVDFYAIPGQKWLCGPEGVGALYVRHDRLILLRPTFVSVLSLYDPGSYTLSGDYFLAPNAQRYETSSVFRPGYFAMLASLRWIDEVVGWEWAYAQIQRINAYARSSLAQLPGATIVTPPAQAGLLTVQLTGIDPVAVTDALSQQRIIVRAIPLQGAQVLRISTGFYTSEADIDRLCEALAQAIAAQSS